MELPRPAAGAAANRGGSGRDVRTKMHRAMLETVADEAAHGNWTYWAYRPLRAVIWHPGMRIKSDCSTGARTIARTGDAPDPMGRDYDPYGNSATACAHLPHLDHISELEVGDYVTFGYLGGDHMTCVQETGPDPLLWSDGAQGAPNNYRLSWDHREYQLLHNPVRGTPETPQDVLRAKSGFWAWLQWSLGEGHWKKYGKRNRRVRPSVPRVIPLRWWKRRAHLLFLRRKKRANKATTKEITQ